MEHIRTLKELEQSFSIESLSKVSDYDAYFRMIAESLINNFQICNGDDVYRFVEIEFYLNKTEDVDKKITYDRTTNAGEWFLHDNGVDLAFESNDEIYGGILIRSIKKSRTLHGEGEFINGPRKCSWNLIDGLNAFGYYIHYPLIREAEVQESLELDVFTRHGIKEDNKLYRFTIPLSMWEHKGYSGFPKKRT